MDSIMEIINSPLLVSLVTPVIVKLFTKGLEQIDVAFPKPLKPILAIVLGAAASALGDFTAVTGATMGVAGVGVRETLKPVSKKLAGK